MAIVSLIRTVMGSGDEIASVVSQHLRLYVNGNEMIVELFT